MRHIEQEKYPLKVHREYKGVVSEYLVFMSKKSKDGKVVTHYYLDDNLNVNTFVVSADEFSGTYLNSLLKLTMEEYIMNDLTHLEEEQC